MDKSEIMYKVKNRSASRVVYKDPELKIRREFAPGETKIISYAELEKLSYIPGGRAMMANFLQLEKQAVQKVGIKTEPEYFMSEEQVKNMLLNGSLDEFLDCLDFAPLGVLDLVKQLSVRLPLTDIHKRRALKEKLGFDVDSALRHIEEERIETQEIAPQATRRVKETVAESRPARRTETYYEEVVDDSESAEVAEEEVKKAPSKRGRKSASVNTETEEAVE